MIVAHAQHPIGVDVTIPGDVALIMQLHTGALVVEPMRFVWHSGLSRRRPRKRR